MKCHEAMAAANKAIDALGLADEQATGANIVKIAVDSPLKQIG